MTHSSRLQLPSQRSQSQQPSAAPVPAHRSAEAAIDHSIARQEDRGALAALFTDAKTRQLQADCAEIEEQQAVDLAMSRVDAAADLRLAQLHREAERRRTDLRDRHNVRSGELGLQQVRVTSEAMIGQINLQRELSQQINDSSCSEEDKAMLTELSKIWAQQRMDAKSDSARRPSA
ncbi:MAG: hypothetical protein AB8B91_22195 [Rubripirellula sp.]